MRLRSRTRRGPSALASFFLISLAAAVPAFAQSGDANFPTPIHSDTVTGRISPRDVGDSRRTRHFYVFRAAEGDLTVRLESANLSGDVDVFTADAFRPLLKITLFGGSATNASKSVYLRAEETLVLRVEARAAGDEAGNYRIVLGGSFAPAPAGLAEAPAPALPSAAAERGGGARRVTSTGARIDVPAPAGVRAGTEPPARETTEGPAGNEAVVTSAPPRLAPRRSARGSRTAPRRTRGRAATTPAPGRDAGRGPTTTPEARSEAEDGAGVAAEAARPTPRPRNRGTRPARRSAGESRSTAAGAGAGASPAAAAAPPQRLVIVTKDGETVERDMSTVRRVTIENNQLVVTTKDGRTVRRPLTDVLRMSIEPLPQP